MAKKPKPITLSDFKKRTKTLRREHDDEMVRSLKPLLTKVQKLEKQIRQITKLDLPDEKKREALIRLAAKSKDEFKLGPNLRNAFDQRAFEKKIRAALDELDDTDKKKGEKAATDEIKDFAEKSRATQGALDGLAREAAKLAGSAGGGATDFGAGLAIAAVAVIGLFKKRGGG